MTEDRPKSHSKPQSPPGHVSANLRHQGPTADLALSVATKLDAVSRRLEGAAQRLDREFADEDAIVAAVEAEARTLLTSAHLAVIGSGFAGELRTTTAVTPRMVWWYLAQSGEVFERSHNVNPNAADYYDYSAQRWFIRASSTARKAVTGPFIDTWGADDFTVTIAVPTRAESVLHGVLAADLDVRGFVRDVSELLTECNLPLAVVDDSDRIVASSIPSLGTGLLLAPRSDRSQGHSNEVRRSPVRGYDWYVVELTPPQEG